MINVFILSSFVLNKSKSFDSNNCYFHSLVCLCTNNSSKYKIKIVKNGRKFVEETTLNNCSILSDKSEFLKRFKTGCHFPMFLKEFFFARRNYVMPFYAVVHRNLLKFQF